MSLKYTSLCLVGAVFTIAGVAASAANEQQNGAQASSAASRGVMQDRSHKSPAEALFVEKCSMCHRDKGMGTVLLSRRMDPKLAPLENRKDLEPDFVKSVVRGGLMNMPAIPKGEVSDQQLDVIAVYLSKGPRS